MGGITIPKMCPIVYFDWTINIWFIFEQKTFLLFRRTSWRERALVVDDTGDVRLILIVPMKLLLSP